ncbi:MAG: peptidylprolyl isomerase [Candidatus Muirbacterium halophilum]|nr:peptidylprolyl isomerase [Candidatus Muirbacterium halophilum]
MIENNNIVSVHYTGSLADGTIFDSSIDRDPLTFKMGEGQLIPGFEKAILGKNIGDKVNVNIPCTEAYGELREDLYVEVKKEQLPGQVEVGMSLQAQDNDGNTINVSVKEILENSVIINGNHPLAGKELIFDIEIMDIK